MLDILQKWNRWGSNKLDSGIPRQITPRILAYKESQEIVVLIGPRRSGKSTILYQIMDALEGEGVEQRAMLHLNFEEPRLTSFLTLKGLDDLYDCYREHLFPEGKAYLFLDEIQNIPEWERWVRARNQTEDIKIFVTGSSAKLMSREIATLLTGRHLSFEVSPLNFAEYLEFQKISLPVHKLPVTPPAPIRHALNEYIQWGGFPAVVLAKTLQHKQDILAEYFGDILFKDIVLRHSVRDPILLRNIAIHLLTQTGKLLSFHRVATIFQMSADAAINYCRYIQEAFVVELVPFFSLKAAIRQRHPHKIHAMDLGLRNAVSLAHSEDEGRLIETLVYHCLRRRVGDNVFYWSGENEIDFVVREGNSITEIWQVVSGRLDDDDVVERELKGFIEAAKLFPDAKAFLAVKTLPQKPLHFSGKVVPLWLLLIGSS